MKNIFVILIIVVLILSLRCNRNKTFQLTDLHIHLKGGFTIDDAVAKSVKENINYGIAANCGLGLPIYSDNQIDLSCLL